MQYLSVSICVYNDNTVGFISVGDTVRYIRETAFKDREYYDRVVIKLYDSPRGNSIGFNDGTNMRVYNLWKHAVYRVKEKDTNVFKCYAKILDDLKKIEVYARNYGMVETLINRQKLEIVNNLKKEQRMVIRGRHAGKSISWGKFTAEYAEAWADFDFENKTIKEVEMNSGNLTNPIEKVRFTLVNGVKLKEMNDRQLIAAINNFNAEINELEAVNVESVALDVHVQTLYKAIKVVTKELDKRVA